MPDFFTILVMLGGVASIAVIMLPLKLYSITRQLNRC
jgi:hypothetical protein